MFSFWINDIQAKKEALFDICGLMQKICWTENLLELLGFSYIVPRISIRLHIRHSCWSAHKSQLNVLWDCYQTMVGRIKRLFLILVDMFCYVLHVMHKRDACQHYHGSQSRRTVKQKKCARQNKKALSLHWRVRNVKLARNELSCQAAKMDRVCEQPLPSLVTFLARCGCARTSCLANEDKEILPAASETPHLRQSASSETTSAKHSMPYALPFTCLEQRRDFVDVGFIPGGTLNAVPDLKKPRSQAKGDIPFETLLVAIATRNSCKKWQTDTILKWTKWKKIDCGKTNVLVLKYIRPVSCKIQCCFFTSVCDNFSKLSFSDSWRWVDDFRKQSKFSFKTCCYCFFNIFLFFEKLYDFRTFFSFYPVCEK